MPLRWLFITSNNIIYVMMFEYFSTTQPLLQSRKRLRSLTHRFLLYRAVSFIYSLLHVAWRLTISTRRALHQKKRNEMLKRYLSARIAVMSANRNSYDVVDYYNWFIISTARRVYLCLLVLRLNEALMYACPESYILHSRSEVPSYQGDLWFIWLCWPYQLQQLNARCSN